MKILLAAALFASSIALPCCGPGPEVDISRPQLQVRRFADLGCAPAELDAGVPPCQQQHPL